MSKSIKQVNEWKHRIQTQQASGQNVTQWCRENKLYPRSYYYWKSKIFSKKINRSDFTELKDQKDTGIVIEYQKILIHLDKNFDLRTLKECLTLLRKISC